jgi:hypothetical protein
VAPVSTWRTTTVAPETEAPLASWTEPLRLAPTICACAVSAPAKVTRAKKRYNFAANVTVSPEVFLVINGPIFRTWEDCAADQLRNEFSARKILKREFESPATTTTVPPGGGGAELRVGENESHDAYSGNVFD